MNPSTNQPESSTTENGTSATTTPKQHPTAATTSGTSTTTSANTLANESKSSNTSTQRTRDDSLPAPARRNNRTPTHRTRQNTRLHLLHRARRNPRSANRHLTRLQHRMHSPLPRHISNPRKETQNLAAGQPTRPTRRRTRTPTSKRPTNTSQAATGQPGWLKHLTTGEHALY